MNISTYQFPLQCFLSDGSGDGWFPVLVLLQIVTISPLLCNVFVSLEKIDRGVFFSKPLPYIYIVMHKQELTSQMPCSTAFQMYCTVVG